MKFLGLIFLMLLASCAQKKTMTPPPAVRATTPKISLFDNCTRVDTKLDEIWILLCQKDPHPLRSEIYEYSKLYQSMKRLTYQDGIISEIVVKDFDDIFYVSTYDESKEQFVSVSKGQPAGTDIYLKKRSQTSFIRKTEMIGTEKNLFWHAETQKLYFVHVNNERYKIMTLDKNDSLQVQYDSKVELSHPTLLDKTLYWLEWNPEAKKMSLQKKLANNKPARVFESHSRILAMKPESNHAGLLIVFTTGLGTELWSFDPKTLCWQIKLRTQSRWNDFYQTSPTEVFVSLEKQLELQNLVKAENTCEPSPPGLGVESVK